MLLTEEGYIEKSGSTYTHHYYLKDHIGNHRIVMNSAGTVVQATNYYPSGTTMADYPRATTQGVQPYKFGGKELDRKDNLNFYDYEARAYDPALMRFTSTDPMMEKYYAWSPFAYCLNNPVNRIDPTGLTDYKVNENGYISDNSSLWDKIKKLFNSPDKTDKLIASNGNTLTMKAGTMTEFTDKKKNGKLAGQTFNVSSTNSAEQIHEFLSENVKNIEFGAVDVNKSGESFSVISNSFKRNENDAPNVAQEFLKDNATVHQITHNHPDGSIPSGYQRSQLDTNDKDVVTHFNKYFPNNFIVYRVYDSKNKKYIYYDENRIIKVEPKKAR
jgi:RHS repeat-associated protein